MEGNSLGGILGGRWRALGKRGAERTQVAYRVAEGRDLGGTMAEHAVGDGGTLVEHVVGDGRNEHRW